jgi:hypothetical protein
MWPNIVTKVDSDVEAVSIDNSAALLETVSGQHSCKQVER